MNFMKLLRYGELKSLLRKHGVNGVRLRRGLKLFPRIKSAPKSRAYYSWETAKKIFNIK